MYLNGIETKRLRFRNLKKSDIKIWRDFFLNNPDLEFLGLDLSLDYKAQSTDWIECQFRRYEENRFGHHALIEKQTNNFIGQSGLLGQVVEGKTELEIGYHILPEYWGLGYATEAALQIRDYAFKKELSNSLISIIDIRNIKSQHVAVKLGMKPEKQIKLYGLDVYIYRICSKY